MDGLLENATFRLGLVGMLTSSARLDGVKFKFQKYLGNPINYSYLQTEATKV